MITELYIGSGPNLLYPGLTEIIRKNSELNQTLEFDSAVNISLISALNNSLELRSRVYG